MKTHKSLILRILNAVFCLALSVQTSFAQPDCATFLTPVAGRLAATCYTGNPPIVLGGVSYYIPSSDFSAKLVTPGAPKSYNGLISDNACANFATYTGAGLTSAFSTTQPVYELILHLAKLMKLGI